MKTLSVQNQAELSPIAPAIDAAGEQSLPRKHWVCRIENIIRCGTLKMTLPDGTNHILTGKESSEPAADIEIRHYRALRRLFLHGDIGFAESYLEGEWLTSDLSKLFAFGLANEQKLENASARWSITRLMARIRHLLNANSLNQAKKNIAYHYDLGNDFYRRWLDRSMTYSAAIFDAASTDSAEDLIDAQRRKYARLAETLEIENGDDVLEIGCGWGGFMQHVIENTNAQVTGVSISKEQCAYATQRIAKIDADNRGSVLFKDYRDLDGSYDRIASIEMFEAVGEKYWPTYAGKLKQLLKPDGVAALQIITIDEKRFERYKNSADFIQRYIFPGGMLPSRTALRQLMAEHGLRVTEEFCFGPDYAETLRRWRSNFDAAWPEISTLGFDERFKRMWHYYLAYCEVGFDHGAIDVVQIRVEHDS